MEVSMNSVSAPVAGHDGLPSYQEHADGPIIRIIVRPSANRTQQPFEFAKLRLQGAIRTQVGSRTSVEKVLCLTGECSWSQFAPLQNSDGSVEHAYSAAVAFNECEKSTSGPTSQSPRPLSSTRISGSAYITKHTALRDQHLVQVRCETYCWVTADFYSNGALVQSSQALVNPLPSPSLISLRSPKSDEREIPAVTCRPYRSNLFRLRRSRRIQPSACVRLPAESLIVNPTSKEENRNCSTISLPFSVSLNDLSQTDIDTIGREGGLQCEIETKWISRRIFTAGTPDGHYPESAKVTQRATSTQQSRILFPPFYDASAGDNNAPLCSTATLELLRPTSAVLPTLCTELLQVEYELEMTYCFRLGSGMGLEGKLKTGCVLEG